MSSRLLLLLAFLLAGPAAAEELRAGAARIDITPPTGFAMWGYASRKDQPSQGVRDPLFARAVVLEVGKDRIAIVALARKLMFALWRYLTRGVVPENAIVRAAAPAGR